MGETDKPADGTSGTTAVATPTQPSLPFAPGEEDALIDKIIAKREGTAPPPFATPEAPEAEEQPEPDEAAPKATETAKAEAKPEPEADGGGADAEAYEKALTSLRLDGVPQSVLEKLGRTDLIAWGSKASKRQAKTATELQQRTEKIRALEEAQATKPPEQQPTGDADLETALKPAIEALDELGTDAGAKLSQALKALQAKLESKVAAVEQTSTVFGSHLAEIVMDSARSKLTERFPELADDGVFTTVQEKMTQLAKSGAYADLPLRQALPAALEDAARIILFDSAAKRASDAVSTQHRKRANGQMTPPSRAPESKKMDDAERENRFIELLNAGDREAAVKFYRG